MFIVRMSTVRSNDHSLHIFFVEKLSVDISELVYFSPSDSITGNCRSEGKGTLSLLIDGKFQQNSSNNLLQFELSVDQMASYFVLQCMVTSLDIVNGNTEKILGVTRHEDGKRERYGN